MRSRLGDAATQELIIIIGVYLLVCRYLETLGIEIEDTALAGSGLEEIKRSMKSHV